MMTTFLLLSAAALFRVDPWFRDPILPDADPPEGRAVGTLELAAARGEYEPVSFVVRPDRDYAKVDVVVSDLTGPSGAKIPAAAADVTSVKVWFRPKGRWLSEYKGDQNEPTPINNLVLHDDSLVKVDWERKVNYLRADYPAGPRYLDVSHRDLRTRFDHDAQPVRDAPRFVPFDLKKDFRQQYLVTFHVPKDASAGIYRGTLTLRDGTGAAVLSRPLVLRVHPFELPIPRTHYDATKEYCSYWMGQPTLGGLVKTGHRLDRAERKLRAILRNMVAHNAANVTGVGTFTDGTFDDLAVRTLVIARQEGMRADPLVNGSSFDPGTRFVFSPGSAPAVPEEHPEDYAKSLGRFRADVERQNAFLDRLLGHHRCIYSSPDECGAHAVRRSYGYMSVLHELGGLCWTDSGDAERTAIALDINDIAGHMDHREAWDWHLCGAKCVTYACPFTGPECPEMFRRTKGIRFWYADFDGQHEYCFFDGRRNRWNDFVRYSNYCQFGIVYFTEDGLVSTLAWEANREAYDDIRYYTLLRLRAEAAFASSDPETRKLGRAALVWQDGVDPELVPDLDAFRAEVAAWIVRLIDRVGPQPADAVTELPPPALPPETAAKDVPPKGAPTADILAYADARVADDRWDLALLALANVHGDEKLDPAVRAEAAIRASGLHSQLQERAAALKPVEALLKVRTMPGPQRGKLLLARVNALTTDEQFEEIYTVAQLDEASAALAEALAQSGTAEVERYAAVARVTQAYLSAGAYEKCIALAKARLVDVRMTGPHQADIHMIAAEAHKRLGNWKDALKAFSEAHRAFNNEQDRNFRRRICITEAEAAEKAGDYLRAVACWTAVIPCYNKEEKSEKDHALREVRRLEPLSRKSNRIKAGSLDDDDNAAAIDLDE